MFDTTIGVISYKHYPYRTARVLNIFLEIDYKNNDDLSKFHQDLATMSNTYYGNHQCFALTHQSGTKLYLMFSDLKCYVGTHILVQSW